jgi:hypothetical protein
MRHKSQNGLYAPVDGFMIDASSELFIYLRETIL